MALQSDISSPPPARLIGRWGNMLQFGRDPLGHSGRLFERYGPVVLLAKGAKTNLYSPLKDCPGTVLAYGPEATRAASTQHEIYLRFPLSGPRYRLKDQSQRTAPLKHFGVGLFGVNLKEHRQHRRLVMPAFHVKHIGSYRDSMVEITESFLDSWRIGEQRNMMHELRLLTMRIATRTLFGEDIGAHSRSIGLLLQEAFSALTNPLTALFPYDLPGLPFHRFIGLAHEALLREWPPAVQWIEQNRQTLRLRAGIAAAAALWRNSDLREDRLMAGALLKDAAKLLSAGPEMLAPEERRYVHLSIAENRRQRRRLISRGVLAAAAVALAILIPTIGWTQITYGISFARTLPVVWNVDRHAPVPVSVSALTNLRASIDALASDLQPQAKEVGDRPELNPWAAAEIWLALHGLDLGLADPGRKLREFMTTHRDPGCHCWRETDDKLPNTVTTAWVLYALARYDQPATADEIESALKRQGKSGWWAMYLATPDEKNASTSAMAWTAPALHHQLERKLVALEQEAKVAEAIQKAAEWLDRSALPGTARWAEYPPSATFEKGEYLAASALVIHVLRTVAASNRFDALWLDRLPQSVPDPLQNEISKEVVFRSTTQITLDEVRHYLFPWMLRTTVESYANGNASQRARAVLWIDAAFKRPLHAEDFHSEYWTIAETLFALRHVETQLNANSAQSSRNRPSTFIRNRTRVAASM